MSHSGQESNHDLTEWLGGPVSLLRPGAGAEYLDPLRALPAVTLSVSPGSVAEDGASNLIYTFARTGASTSSLTVFYTLAGSATNGSDYVGVPTKGTTKSIVIPAGSLTAQIIVNPTGDTAGETDESVSLTLAPALAYSIGTLGAVTGLIANDDPVTTVVLELASDSVAEDGADNLVYVFTRTGQTATALTVNYAVTGSATIGVDYTGIPTKGTTKTIVFAPGATVAQVIVNPVADAIPETDETVALTLRAGTGYIVGTPAPVVGVVANDEIVANVSLAVSESSVIEDGATNLIYAFTRSGPTETSLIVNYLVGGTAANGVDYAGLSTSGSIKTVTIAAGSSAAFVTVDPTADTIIEPEETISLTLAAGTGYLAQTAGPVSARIIDDDAVAVSLALTATSVSEDGAQDLVYVFTRTGSAAAALTVNYSLGGTAAAGVDYAASAIGAVTFLAGSSTAVLQIDPVSDFAAESAETVSVTIASGTGYTIATTAPVQGAVADDDTGFAFTLQSRPGANLTIYLDFNGASLAGTAWAGSVVNAPAFDLDSNPASFSTAEQGFIREIFYRVAADFAPFNVNVTTQWLGQETISRASSSDTVYGTVCLFSPIGNLVAPGAGGVAYLRAFDDLSDYYKPALVFPEKFSDAKNIAEAASHEIGHNLGLDHDGTGTASYYTGQGTAPGWAPVMGVGYYKPLVQWSKGQYVGASNTQDDLAIIGSQGPTLATDDYANSSLFALGASAVNPVELTGAGRISGSAAANDFDQFYFDVTKAGIVTISARNALAFQENGIARTTELPTGVGNLRLDCDVYNSAGSLVYNWTPSSALNAEYSFNATSVGRYYLRVDGAGSSTDLETDYGSLGDYVVSVSGAGVLVNSTAAISLAVAPTSVLEDGAATMAFTFTRTGSTASALTVNYAVGGSALLGVDYTGISATGTTKTIVFAAGSATANVIIDPTADSSIESDETLSLTIASGSGYTITTVGAVTGTILDDEAAPEVTLVVLPSSVVEDGTSNLVYAFTRSGATTGDLVVNYTIGGTAILGTDYTGVSSSGATKTVTILSGSSFASVIVDPSADTSIESNETVALTLATGAGYSIGTSGAVVAEIVDDDGATAVSVSVSASSLREDDAGNLVYKFTRSGGSTADALTVNYSVSGSASLGTDYVGVSSATGAITIAAGATFANLVIDPTADTNVESNETVTLSLASGAGYALGSTTSVTATIQEDDSANAFTLQSRPGANITVYLDFDGASLAGTAWGGYSGWGGASPVAPAFDRNGDASTFSAAEQAIIRDVFYRVAADFAPFDVNVTTQWLGQETITRSTTSDSSYGTVCLFSAIGDIISPGAGGIAYVDVFDMTSDYYKPALVFPEKLSYNSKNIAEAASHEIGHNLGLSHDGTSSVGYYTGQGSSPGWAPIMGVGYYEPLSQWSKGEYVGANNGQDDVSIIAAQGPVLIADDYANATRYALASNAANPGELVGYGRIGSTSYATSGNDVDLFYFDVVKAGTISVSAKNALFFAEAGVTRMVELPDGFGDLRIDCDLYDAASGALLYDWSPNASINAAFAFNFASTGRYFLKIDGVGSTSDGESDYGSMGSYALSVLGGSAGLSASVAEAASMELIEPTIMSDCFDPFIEVYAPQAVLYKETVECYWL